MGIFSFLKKLGKEKEIEEIVVEKLSFPEIEGWLDKKREENESKEKEILVLIKDKIRDFNDNLKGKIITLNEFDVGSKKAEDKLKGIVRDSRVQYVELVENLMANLGNLNETSFPNLTKKIDRIFLDFNKASHKNYERATILIGKEMASIKEGFKAFSKDLLGIFNDNKEISGTYQKIESLKEKLKLLGPVEENKTEITESLISINKKIDKKAGDNRELLEEIETIKQSEDHKKMLEQKEKINTLKEETKGAIFSLKQLIDFKALANFFHINEGQMAILKDHKEDFHTHFMKDEGKSIIGLLGEAKLGSDSILEKVNFIKSKLEENSIYERGVGEDETKGKYSKLKEINLDLDNLKAEKIKEEKREEKIDLSKGELIDSLKQELSKMNVEIV